MDVEKEMSEIRAAVEAAEPRMSFQLLLQRVNRLEDRFNTASKKFSEMDKRLKSLEAK